MAAEELLDDHVSTAQCKKAVDALLSHELKVQEEKTENDLLGGKEVHVWLVITTKQMHPEGKLKPAKIPLKHPLVDPRTSPICLITKDPQREYKDLLEKHNIRFISRVVGVTKLKGKFKPFEARRLLLKENGLFLADERVVPLLPKLLGKLFFKAKKQPIPVCLTRKDLKGELERAVSATYFHQNQGTCVSVKIGTLSQNPSQVLDNLKTALPAVVKHVKGGWDNIQAFHIKTNSSASLPIWTCGLGTEDGSRWDGLLAREEEEESEQAAEQEEDMEEKEVQTEGKKRKRTAGEDAEGKESKKKAKAKAPASSEGPVEASGKEKRAAKDEAEVPKKKKVEASSPAAAEEISTPKEKTKGKKRASAESEEPEPTSTAAAAKASSATAKKQKPKAKASKDVAAVSLSAAVAAPAPAPVSIMDRMKGKAVAAPVATAVPSKKPAPSKPEDGDSKTSSVRAAPATLKKDEIKQKRAAAGLEKKKGKVAEAKLGTKPAKAAVLGKRKV